MKPSTAKKLSIPTLAERITALKEEAEDALDRLSETHRPPGVPGPQLKRMWLAKAAGNQFEAYLIAAGKVGA